MGAYAQSFPSTVTNRGFSHINHNATVVDRLGDEVQSRFQRDYRRHGHLFQDRYKSILCQEDAYLLELVRYIHLNPLRTGLLRGSPAASAKVPLRLEAWRDFGHTGTWD